MYISTSGLLEYVSNTVGKILGDTLSTLDYIEHGNELCGPVNDNMTYCAYSYTTPETTRIDDDVEDPPDWPEPECDEVVVNEPEYDDDFEKRFQKSVSKFMKT